MSDIIAVMGLILFIVGAVISVPAMMAISVGEVAGWDNNLFATLTKAQREQLRKQAAKEERLGVLLALTGIFICVIGVGL